MLFAQSMLKFLSGLYSGFDNVEVSGVNDAATAQSLQSLQNCAGTGCSDGTLDRDTWNALAGLFGVMFR